MRATRAKLLMGKEERMRMRLSKTPLERFRLLINLFKLYQKMQLPEFLKCI